MSGIVRAPSRVVYFSIPYSGSHALNDCILIATAIGSINMIASYTMGGWSYESYITYFSDENNVISFKTSSVGGDSSAAFIPGPEHV